MEDTILAQQVSEDPAAFAELYRQHINRVYPYLLARSGNVQDARGGRGRATEVRHGEAHPRLEQPPRTRFLPDARSRVVDPGMDRGRRSGP